MHRDDVRVAAPCSEDWDRMSGDERVRFCGTCAKSVHHLSARSEAEAGAFLGRRSLGDSVCVRYRVDATGEIVFRDTVPHGSTRLRVASRRRRLVAVVATLAWTAAAPALAGGVELSEAQGPACAKPSRVERWVDWAWSWWEAPEAVESEVEEWTTGVLLVERDSPRGLPSAAEVSAAEVAAQEGVLVMEVEVEVSQVTALQPQQVSEESVSLKPGE